MTAEIKDDHSRFLDNFFESFIWKYPDLKISHDDFISAMLMYCDSKMINVTFEFDMGGTSVKFAKSEINKILNNEKEN